jgi:hypothetical protein
VKVGWSRRLAVLLLVTIGLLGLVAAPARADVYHGVAQSTFSCWTAASGNQYCATIKGSIAENAPDNPGDIAYRVNIWCTVNGNPSNCQITWTGGLKRYRSDLGPEFATYPWGTATNQTSGGSSQVIWQGGWHNAHALYNYVWQTVGSVNVRWIAPNKLSSTKTRCSNANFMDDHGNWSHQFSGPLNCM